MTVIQSWWGGAGGEVGGTGRKWVMKILRSHVKFCCCQFLLLFFFPFFILFYFFCFLGSHLQHMEVPRREVKSKLQLLTYTTATAM